MLFGVFRKSALAVAMMFILHKHRDGRLRRTVVYCQNSNNKYDAGFIHYNVSVCTQYVV